VKIWRGLTKRILLGSILCGLLGLLVSHLLIRRSAREAVTAGLVPYIHHSIEAGELAHCERDPSTWSVRLPRGLRVDAYDSSTLASTNPQAPPLDRALYERLLGGEPSPLRFYPFPGEQAGAMLLRAAPDGPCSLLQVTFPPHAGARRRFSYLIVAGVLIVMALATALGFVAVVRPVAQRIGRIRAAAGLVGAPSGYASASDGVRDELGELSVVLDQAHARIRGDAERLEQRHQALERHLAEVAHDLRTPISSLQIALEQADGMAKDAELRDLIRSSLTDVVYLAGLTDNLRMATQLREGWDPAEGDPTADLADTVERAAGRARFFAKNRGISLESSRPDEGVPVRCHPIAAEQIVTNLVFNAIAYGDVGGHVAVLLETHAARFVLSVIDDGPGVPPAELPRLTERTFRADEARQRDPSGSGLGLAITREICERCGFSLTVAPQEPRGLRVRIEGPVLSRRPG
jgi:signal transduction histidine kinase